MWQLDPVYQAPLKSSFQAQEIAIKEPINEEEEVVFEAAKEKSTEVEDSDEEAEAEAEVEVEVVEEPVKPKKKVTKKAAAPEEESSEEPVKPKKKVTKKKVAVATD